jgi:hypothetical protein
MSVNYGQKKFIKSTQDRQKDKKQSFEWGAEKTIHLFGGKNVFYAAYNFIRKNAPPISMAKRNDEN